MCRVQRQSLNPTEETRTPPVRRAVGKMKQTAKSPRFWGLLFKAHIVYWGLFSRTWKFHTSVSAPLPRRHKKHNTPGCEMAIDRPSFRKLTASACKPRRRHACPRSVTACRSPGLSWRAERQSCKVPTATAIGFKVYLFIARGCAMHTHTQQQYHDKI